MIDLEILEILEVKITPVTIPNKKEIELMNDRVYGEGIYVEDS